MSNGSSSLPTPGKIPPELIKQFLDTQASEINLKTQELELKKQEDTHNFEFSQRALDAQVKDRLDQRIHNRTLSKYLYIAIGVIVFIIAAVIVFALYLNKESVAMELVKAIMYLIAGGFGGYGLSKYNQKPSTENLPE